VEVVGRQQLAATSLVDQVRAVGHDVRAATLMKSQDGADGATGAADGVLDRCAAIHARGGDSHAIPRR
jgi:hypothetical protein